MNREGRVADKVALVSGGARGLGAATARLLAREGAAVVIGDVLADDGEVVAREIRSGGGRATFVDLDVTDELAWQTAVAAAVDTYGRLDILVNNAGITIRASIEDTDAAEWDQVMTINAKGTFLGTKHALPALRSSGGGSIVNVSSVVALVGSPALTAAYGASKGAIRSFTKFTAVQHACDGIRCNSVHPGPMLTDMNQAIADPAKWEERLQRLPMRRVGTVHEVASGILFLASDEASYMTGAELVIDGGTSAQ